uniref:HSF-type DNA-binding domain-containing protein n=1 Tax=Ditylum brightwellii TaxID=49249 RepID=A0A7S4RYA9_9STRA
MSNDQENPDRICRWLNANKRNISSLSDSSEQDRTSNTSSISASSATRSLSACTSSSKTNSVSGAVVTSEESSAHQSRKIGSSPSSSDSERCTHSPLVHLRKRRKSVNTDPPSPPELKKARVEVNSSSASSDTSEKDYSSSSSILLYKCGTANSNVETFVSQRGKHNDTSSDTSDNGDVRQKKDMADGAEEHYSRSVSSTTFSGNAKDSADSSEEANCGMKSYLCSSVSSDTSDPESTGSSSTSSSLKRKKSVVRNVLQTYQNSFCSTPFDTNSTGSSSTSSSNRQKKSFVDKAMRTYTISSSSSSEGNKAENKKLEVCIADEKNEEFFLPSSPTQSSIPTERSARNEKKNAAASSDGYALIFGPIPPHPSNATLDLNLLSSKIDSCIYQNHSHITVEAVQTKLEQRKNSSWFSNKEPPFPQKLHEILAEPNNQEWIAWLPHGRAWKILDKTKLEENILPHYFRGCKLASFMRQVNNWGFDRVHFGPDENAYYNEVSSNDLTCVCDGSIGLSCKSLIYPLSSTFCLCYLLHSTVFSPWSATYCCNDASPT